MPDFVFLPNRVEQPKGPTDFIFPGRASQVIVCKQCGACVDLKIRFDMEEQKVKGDGQCENGHAWSESWLPGQMPGVQPFSVGMDFQPVRRG